MLRRVGRTGGVVDLLKDKDVRWAKGRKEHLTRTLKRAPFVCHKVRPARPGTRVDDP